jgi:hypothetical protein
MGFPQTGAASASRHAVRNSCLVITNGNCPNTDILCSNVEGNRFVHVQVKTFVPGKKTCQVGAKAEKDFGESFFWVLSGVPDADGPDDFTYYIVPTKDMATNVKETHKLWSEAPGKNGQARNADTTVRTVNLPPALCTNGWDLTPYKNRWELIVDKLQIVKGFEAAGAK